MANFKTKIKEAFSRFRRSDNGNGSNDEDVNESRTSNSSRSSENTDGLRVEDLADPSTLAQQLDLGEGLLSLQDLLLNSTAGTTTVLNSTNVSVGPRIYINSHIDQRQYTRHGNDMYFSNSNNGRRVRNNRSQYSREQSSGSQSSLSSQSEASESTRPSTSRSEASSSQNQNDIPLMTQDIRNLMESRIEPSHEYLYCISWNQGSNWKETYFSLGYNLGEIDTVRLDVQCRGDSVREARYQLLQRWIQNNDDNSLGHLASKLWEAREWDIVEKLAEIYKNDELRNTEDEEGGTAETSFNTR